jgi:hypothetical protein
MTLRRKVLHAQLECILRYGQQPGVAARETILALYDRLPEERQTVNMKSEIDEQRKGGAHGK